MSNAPAADYALSILETLSQNNLPLGISDISHITGINKNAVSRVLGALVEKGWVCQEELKYQLTLKPFRMASNALGRISFFSAAQPVLTELWKKIGDSCYMAILENDAALYLGHLDSVRDLKISGRVGGCYPLENSAPGKVLLAYAAATYRQHYLRDVLRKTDAEILSMQQQLAQIRSRGYATDNEEYGPGILCFAAPVFHMDGTIAGTIGTSTSTVYCNLETLISVQGTQVLAAAREITEKLGG